MRNTPSKRMPDPREQTVSELLHPTPEMLRARGPLSHFHGELHSRLATPLLTFSYAVIGLASILAGAFNRRGMGGRILFGAVVIIVTQAAFMTLNGVVARNDAFAVALYAIALLPTPIGLALLASESLRLGAAFPFGRRVLP